MAGAHGCSLRLSAVEAGAMAALWPTEPLRQGLMGWATLCVVYAAAGATLPWLQSLEQTYEASMGSL